MTSSPGGGGAGAAAAGFAGSGGAATLNRGPRGKKKNSFTPKNSQKFYT